MRKKTEVRIRTIFLEMQAAQVRTNSVPVNSSSYYNQDAAAPNYGDIAEEVTRNIPSLRKLVNKDQEAAMQEALEGSPKCWVCQSLRDTSISSGSSPVAIGGFMDDLGIRPVFVCLNHIEKAPSFGRVTVCPKPEISDTPLKDKN